MEDDIWTLNLFCDGAFNGPMHVQKNMDRNIICYFNLVGLIVDIGYLDCDFIYFLHFIIFTNINMDVENARMTYIMKRREYHNKKDGRGVASMVAIESDWQVDEMCKQFESEKRQGISQSNTLHGPKTELVTDLGDAIAEVDDLCVLVNDAVSDSSNPSLVDEDFLQLYNNDLEGKLKEIRRQKEDPDERCEGDTDVEDIFPLTINLLDTRSTPIARRKGKETAIQHDNPPSPLANKTIHTESSHVQEPRFVANFQDGFGIRVPNSAIVGRGGGRASKMPSRRGRGRGRSTSELGRVMNWLGGGGCSNTVGHE
uniref:Uncharacterized protein n=1 Tax=Oryza nivara TaxID=4536 RepID=A0A0E0HNA0_ORYNI